uniref:Globin-sensor domain-containing protein n=1 Tax=Thermofilum pendens TaxID=2269 RepID=A0A7C4BB10_THEPE
MSGASVKSGAAEREKPIGSVLISNCERFSSLFGITDDVKRMLRELSKNILARKGEIVAKALDLAMRDYEVSEALERAGLDEKKAKRFFEYWFTTVFQGNYDERHCLDIARIGLMLVRGGLPSTFLSTLVSAFLAETLETMGGDPKYASAMARAFGWNLAMMTLSYEILRERIFWKATGIHEEVYERLISIYSKRLMKELVEELKAHYFVMI